MSGARPEDELASSVAGIPASRAPDDGRGPVGGRVLVTGGEGLPRQAVRHLLRGMGHAVADADVARDGATAATVIVLLLRGDDSDVWQVAEVADLTSARPVPLIVLGAPGTQVERAELLALGATDFLADPWSALELLQRVRHFLRILEAAGRPDAPPRTRDLPVVLDPDRQVLHHRGRAIPLTPTQFSIMDALLEKPGALVTREDLLHRLYPDVRPEWRDPMALTAHIYRLRHKIEDDPAHPRVLATVRGLGFRLGTDDAPRDEPQPSP
jgi:DNA-binding response OmpR family regulator